MENLADEERVVAGFVDGVTGTVKHGEDVFEDGCAVRIEAIRDGGELLLAATVERCEVVGKRNLFVGEEMDGKVLGANDQGNCSTAPLDILIHCVRA